MNKLMSIVVVLFTVLTLFSLNYAEKIENELNITRDSLHWQDSVIMENCHGVFLAVYKDRAYDVAKCIDSLERAIAFRDSIMSEQAYYILQLTYQHEDDEILMEEEWP